MNKSSKGLGCSLHFQTFRNRFGLSCNIIHFIISLYQLKDLSFIQTVAVLRGGYHLELLNSSKIKYECAIGFQLHGCGMLPAWHCKGKEMEGGRRWEKGAAQCSTSQCTHFFRSPWHVCCSWPGGDSMSNRSGLSQNMMYTLDIVQKRFYTDSIY